MQAFLNLARNAVETAGPDGRVRIEAEGGDGLVVRILDDSPGIPKPDNLFVSFFTTKPGGCGIGLVLSQQIAEAHGDTLTVENSPGGRGALATLQLPPPE